MTTTPTTPTPPAEDVPERGKRNRTTVVILVVIAVLAVIAAIAVLVWPKSKPAANTPGNQPSATATIAPTGGGSATAGPTTGAPSATATGTGTPAPAPFGYQPLWPFADRAQAEQWQRDFRQGGHQPWHLDADATALSFTTGYLQFSGINVVVSRTISGDDARVAVGYPIEGRGPATAAVLHLVRFGSGTDAPWEVVGTDDTTFSLTTPAYGATVSSPVTVGGKITGVDENILVQVRQQSSVAPIGQAAPVPAGGQNSSWSTTVSFTGASGTLTIVASTGGHYTGVERFAITGVRAG